MSDNPVGIDHSGQWIFRKGRQKYRWDNPFEWLRWSFRQPSGVTGTELLEFIMGCSDDEIQDHFKPRMEADGYFVPLEEGVSDDIPANSVIPGHEPAGHGEGAL